MTRGGGGKLLILIFFIQRGDIYEKHVLWKIHKHPLIFCVVDTNSHTEWKLQLKCLGYFFFQYHLDQILYQ